jgi:hypothetical protein
MGSSLMVVGRCFSAEVTIDARKRPLHIVYGPNGLRPELDVALAADTLHRILLGQLSLRKALGRKAVRPRGPGLEDHGPGRPVSPGAPSLPTGVARRGAGLSRIIWRKRPKQKPTSATVGTAGG